jgi:hypothetical protein
MVGGLKAGVGRVAAAGLLATLLPLAAHAADSASTPSDNNTSSSSQQIQFGGSSGSSNSSGSSGQSSDQGQTSIQQDGSSVTTVIAPSLTVTANPPEATGLLPVIGGSKSPVEQNTPGNTAIQKDDPKISDSNSGSAIQSPPAPDTLNREIAPVVVQSIAQAVAQQRTNTPSEAPRQTAPVLSSSAAPPATPQAPAPPPQTPIGFLHQLSLILASTFVPTFTAIAHYPAPGLPVVALIVLGTLMLLFVSRPMAARYVSELRRSGFRHAARSDEPRYRNFSLTTPLEMGFIGPALAT